MRRPTADAGATLVTPSPLAAALNPGDLGTLAQEPGPPRKSSRGFARTQLRFATSRFASL